MHNRCCACPCHIAAELPGEAPPFPSSRRRYPQKKRLHSSLGFLAPVEHEQSIQPHPRREASLTCPSDQGNLKSRVDTMCPLAYDLCLVSCGDELKLGDSTRWVIMPIPLENSPFKFVRALQHSGDRRPSGNNLRGWPLRTGARLAITSSPTESSRARGAGRLSKRSGRGLDQGVSAVWLSLWPAPGELVSAGALGSHRDKECGGEN